LNFRLFKGGKGSLLPSVASDFISYPSNYQPASRCPLQLFIAQYFLHLSLEEKPGHVCSELEAGKHPAGFKHSTV